MHLDSRCVTVPAVNLQAFQSCRSNEGWQAVRVQSDSDDKIVYTVLVSPWRANESICDCPGYLFRGSCKHLKRASDDVCRWTGAPGEPRHDACPTCGGPLKYEVEVVDA